jgi:hypothetical protein
MTQALYAHMNKKKNHTARMMVRQARHTAQAQNLKLNNINVSYSILRPQNNTKIHGVQNTKTS